MRDEPAWVEVLARYCNLSYQQKQLGELASMVPGRNEAEEDRPVVGRARRLRPDEVEALSNAYVAGATIYELAEVFGVSRQTVSEHLHRQGVQMRRQGLSPARVDEAVVLYSRGWSLARIGSHLDVDGMTVRARLLERGVAMRPRQGGRR